MRTLLRIVGVVLLLQGLAPLAQSAFGQDPEESFFLVNAVPAAQPWAGLALAALGAGALVLAERKRARRNGAR
ncbi:hypothetical protein OU415_26820 [Saccharopolyspora sp. WRP15-2]|uniref:Secreted protein with PEP-CTERM sorting signal n=1 Tax=Saccharopolyspora oryzae TaxID=2997343 RepID=A0ABT4V706_9PSEU|nr:hypothetical protein [Saccharopolyspora oryzae]MDA3629072.1 hypothetical protein [Saccharopolyspora oryzae]